MKRLLHGVLVLAAIVSGSALQAQGVGISEDRQTAQFSVGGRDYEISRIQNTSNQLTGSYTLTSRPCPQYCIQPIIAAPGVRTLGELEVIEFLEAQVSAGSGLLIDARAQDAFSRGSIPGAVNVPRDVLSVDNPYVAQVLEALGGRPNGSRFNFDGAMELTVFADGPWADEAVSVVRDLISVGYPPGKLGFYRGGMQGWLALGLTVADTRSGG